MRFLLLMLYNIVIFSIGFIFDDMMATIPYYLVFTRTAFVGIYYFVIGLLISYLTMTTFGYITVKRGIEVK